MRSISLLLGLVALACLLFQACALGQGQVQEDQDKVDLMNKQILSDKKTVTTSYKGQPWATSSLNDSYKKTTSVESISPVQVSSALGQSSDYMVKMDSFLKEAKNNDFYLLSVADFLSISGQDKNWAIVDVRTPQLYLLGHIPEALNIPLENLISQMGMIPAGQKVAVYCATDTDAAFAVQALRVYGDREAFVLQGGIVAWQAAGMPVVT
ncbi:MAG: rhodanese-like domain-containing protein [Methanothrix sp.]|nr:rhodanese-like domain-containing protein [Methanothrix sp.]MDD4447853.1 rhodanese-like domain-containing protein [Methanothrix sp.]